jgi:hypothetical protein
LKITLVCLLKICQSLRGKVSTMEKEKAKGPARRLAQLTWRRVGGHEAERIKLFVHKFSHNTNLNRSISGWSQPIPVPSLCSMSTIRKIGQRVLLCTCRHFLQVEVTGLETSRLVRPTQETPQARTDQR